MAKVQRSLLKLFLDVSSSETPQYELIGNGVTEQTINYNPQTEEEVYIHQDSGETEVTSYRPTIPTPMTAIEGDPVFDYIDNLRIKRAVLGDTRTEVILVYAYKKEASGAYPAEKSACSIQVDDFGGAGGESAKVNFTINLNGDPVLGTFNPSTKTFTPNSGGSTT